MREDLRIGDDPPMTAQPPDPEALKQGIAGVFDRSAETYDQVGVDFFTPLARDLVARTALREGERVLDVGAGRGAVVFAAASAVGRAGRVVGIDLSAKMAELTQAEVGARGLANVTVAQGDAERPDFADGSFDAVLASLVMFFLPEPAAAVRRYAALLAPGGGSASRRSGRRIRISTPPCVPSRRSSQAACRPGMSGRALSGHARGSPNS